MSISLKGVQPWEYRDDILKAIYEYLKVKFGWHNFKHSFQPNSATNTAMGISIRFYPWAGRNQLADTTVHKLVPHCVLTGQSTDTKPILWAVLQTPEGKYFLANVRSCPHPLSVRIPNYAHGCWRSVDFWDKDFAQAVKLSKTQRKHVYFGWRYEIFIIPQPFSKLPPHEAILRVVTPVGYPSLKAEDIELI